jgi:hypothetical protein
MKAIGYLLITTLLLSTSINAAESQLDSECQPKDFLSKLESKIRPNKFWNEQLALNQIESEQTEQLFVETLLKVRNFQADTQNIILREALTHQRQGLSKESSNRLLELEMKNRAADLKLNVTILEKLIPERRARLSRCRQIITGNLQKR